MRRPLTIAVVVVGVILAVVLAVVLTQSRARRRSDDLSRPLGYTNFECYVINMRKDAKRMRGFARAYSRCDLARTHSLIRWEGVDGRALNLPEHVSSKAMEEILRAERYKYRTKHYELTRGGIGCWKSHVGLWTHLLDTDKEAMLIFEDDAVMTRDMHAAMKELQPPADWDIVLLGYFCNACEPQPQGTMIRAKRFFGLHGYMIHRKFVKTFLASPHSKVVTKQIDSVLSDMIREGSIKVYASPHKLVVQNNAAYATTIQMPLRKVKGVNEWE